MQLHSTLFANSTLEYARMADVLVLSAAENTPHKLTIHEISDADNDLRAIARAGCKATWLNNARKAKHHCRIIQEAQDGELLGMIDCDAMVLRDLSAVEAMEFDLAYTVRPPGQPWKLNTGVYFVRVSELTKAWCAEWLETVKRMLADATLHEHWRRTQRYGGTHQAAFGYMLNNEHLRHVMRFAELPCEEWNCVSQCWGKAENPRIVHIMGQMRGWCFGAKCTNANARRFVEKWRGYDKRCLEAA